NDGCQQSRTGPACLNEELPFEQDIVVAITLAVIGIGPPVQDAELIYSVMVIVSDAPNFVIDQLVDFSQLRQSRFIHLCKLFAFALCSAFGGLGRTEADPADRHACLCSGARKLGRLQARILSS